MSARTATALLATALTIFGSTASWAADSTAPVPVAPVTAPAVAPLAPGEAAGVRQAQVYQPDQTLLWVGGVVILGVGIGLLVSGHNGHSSSSSTTGTH